MENLIGQMIGRYKVIDELGRGGMSVVLKAVDTALERHVAIKMILPDQQQSEKSLRRFRREAKTLAQLSHPSIVKILDYGEFQNTPYLVMEYISGGTLNSLMDKAMPAAEAASLLLPVARALHHAHQHKVVHRDVKPRNILINETGQPMLSDFGIVKFTESDESQSLTGTGAILGTPTYMAPEQIRGLTVDGRTDEYALAVIFFEMVTGRKPFTGNTPIEVTVKHLNEPIPKPRQFARDIPHNAEVIIMKALAKNPEDRYPNMGAFAEALDKLVKAQKGKTRPIERPAEPEDPNAPKVIKKKTPKFAYYGLALFLVLALVAGFAVVRSLAPKPTPVAAVYTPTEVIIPNTDTPTPEPTSTPEPTVAPTPTLQPFTDTPEPTATELLQATVTSKPANLIQLSNLSNIIELSRMEKVSVIKLAWAPDGSYVVNAGSKFIWVIDPVTMKEIVKINLVNDIPRALAISSDSKRFFVLINNTVRMYDAASRDLLQTYNIPAGANSLAVSPDGTKLALGMSDSKVLVLQVSDGATVLSPRSNYGGWSVAFSPDGKYLATGTSQGVLMWEANTGTWKAINGGQELLIKTVTFSNNGKFLAGGGNGVIIIWNVSDGTEVRRITSNFGNLNSIIYSPDDSLILGACEDSTVRIWNAANGHEEKVLKNHTSPVYSAVFSPDGLRILSGANEGIIRLWGLP